MKHSSSRKNPMRLSGLTPLLLLVLGLLSATAAEAMPSNQKLWTFHQPDGTPFKAVLIGDEFFAYHKTPTGEIILQDPATGYWHYATPKTDGTLERTSFVVGKSTPQAALLNKDLVPWLKAATAAADARAEEIVKSFSQGRKVPPIGTVRGVLLLVNFSDTTTTFAQSDFNALMNTPGYNLNSALGSVKDFYYEASYGAVTIQTDVYGWFSLPQTRYYYGHNTGGIAGNDQNPRQMIIDAVNASNATVNYADYDANGDGWVDFFGVVHQGQGEEQSGAPEDCIWSHRWTLSTAMTVDGKQVKDYHTEPERLYSNLSTIGVYCHEMGHFFNLPDLYDTVGSSEGIGMWSVMASGGWCGPGNNGAKPCHFDPWCKMVLGWLRPTTVYETQSGIPLPNYDQNASVLRVPVDAYQDGEYFLVCNRYQRAGGVGAGFDQYLPGSGALILHVDDYVANNDTVAKKKVDVEEADGLAQLDSGSNLGNSGDLYPNGTAAFNDTSNPNSRDYSGASTGIVVNTFTGAGTASMTCAVTPRTLSGKYTGYDEFGVGDVAIGFDGVDYGCVRFTTASGGTLQRVRTYFTYTGTTNYTLSVYSGWSSGHPSGLLTSQTGSHTGRGFGEITLTTPQTFTAGSDYYVQILFDSGYLYRFVLPFAKDWNCDSRSWVSNDGTTYTNATPAYSTPYDLNIRADLQSATGTIKQDGTADFTSFTDAIHWANGTAGANTLLVLDTGTYTETPPAITEGLTLQGNTATLIGNLTCNSAGISISNLTISGTAANHLDLATSGAAVTMTNCTLDGSSADNVRLNAAGASLNLSNCTVRNAAASGISNRGGTLTMSGCSVYGNALSGVRNVNSACAAVISGGTIYSNGEHGVTCEYAGTTLTLDTSAIIRDNTKSGIYLTASASISATGLTLQDNGYYGIHWTATATSNTNNTFTSCSFRQANLYLCNVEDGCYVKRLEFIDPVFTGKCGDTLAFYVGTSGVGSASSGDGLRIAGTGAGALKVDLDPIVSGGTQRIARIRKGDLSLVKCRGTLISADNAYALDSWGPTALGGDVKVIFDRCYWRNGAGSYGARTEGGGSAKVVVEAVNTAWVWDSAATRNHAAFLSLAGNHAAASELWLRHCTFKSLNNAGGYNLTNSLARGNENYDGSGNSRGDILYGGWTVFDASGVTGLAASSASNLSLTRYTGYPTTPCVAWRASGVTGFASVPAETRNVNPNLAASGYLQDQVSYAALNRAVNSVEASDMDGNARPLPVGTTNDIGACESSYNDTTAPTPGTATPPASSSSSPFDVSYSGAQDNAGGSGLNKVELWYKLSSGGTWTNTGLTQTGATGTFSFSPADGPGTYYFDLAAEDNFGNRTANPSAGDGDGSTSFTSSLLSASGITPTTSSPTNASTIGFSVHFSESVLNFNNASDLVITETGGVAYTGVSVTGGPQDYAVTATGVSGSGTMTLAVSTSSDVMNASSTPLASSVTSAAVTIDHTAPTAATITPTTTSPTNASSIVFAVHFSETVQNFNASADLVITETGGVAHTGATVTGGTQDYAVTVTGVTGSGTMTLAVSTSSDVRDLASNALASSVTSSAVTIDRTAPTAATITPTTTSPTNGSSIVFSVHFSEPVQNFNAAADLVVTETGGVAHTGASITGGTQDYTVTVTSVTGSGTMTLAVSTSSDVQDLLGNALASSVTSSAVTIDHTAPTASTITPTTSSPTNASAVAFSVHFSESVQNFGGTADLVITETGGVAHTGVSFTGGPQDYTVTATGVTGTGTMTLAASTASDVRDLASNALASSVTSSAVTIDHTAPTAATITPTTTSPTNGSSVVFSVHFSESVQYFNAAADLVVTETGGAAHTGATITGGAQDYTVTVTGVTGSGTMTLAANTSSDIRDLALNALTSSVTSSAVTIDHTAPTAATITPTTTSPTSASSIVFSVHFSEAVQNFNAAADLVITETGGVAHTGASFTGGTQDYTVTVTGVTGSGTMTLAANTSSDVRDLASNALASSATSSAVTIDHTTPTAATITPTTTSPTNGSSVVFSVHFSEAVQYFDAAADLVITETGGVAHTGASFTGGTQDYTVTVTGVTGSGTMTLAVSTSSGVQDLLGNALASSVTSSAVTIDHTAPTAATITPTTSSPTNASAVAFSVHFSESVQNFGGTADLVITETGGVAHTGVSFTGGPQDYTVTVTGVTGSGTMALAANTASDVRDLASNALASSVTSSAVTIDHTAPTAATITPTTTSPTNGSSVAFSVHFSESVQYFNAAADLVITETGGVAHTGATFTGGPQDYTVTVTGVTGNGTMTLAVSTSSDIRDLAMNALTSSVTCSAVTIDQTAPTAATITPTTTSPTSASSIVFSVHFSEAMQNFNAAADLVITETGGVAHTGATITGGTQDYTVTVTGVTGSGTMTLAVSTGSDVRDLASNALASSVTSSAVTIEQTAPTAATITPTTTSPTNGSSVAFSVHFSEAVQNFDAAADLVITETGGVAHTGATITGGTQDYTVTVTGVTGNGTMTLAVSTSSGVQDLLGNALASSVTSAAVSLDHTAPTASTITPTTSSPTNLASIVYSVHFSENVLNFNAAADLVITEAGGVAHTGVSITGGAQDYTVTVTGVTGAGTMTLAASASSDVQDTASNALASSVTSAVVTIDRTAPTAATITPTTTSPTNGSSVVFSVHFSEAVQNFNAAADLVVTETGGVAHTGASFAGGAQDYTVTVTGVTGSGTMTLAVSTSSDVQDLLGNALASSVTSSAVTIDHTAPAATAITPTTSSPTNASAIVFAVHFSESVQNFGGTADLVITEAGGVAHTGVSFTGGPQDYTVTVTGVTGSGTMTLAASTSSDVRDLASNALASSVTSSAVTIDHTTPTAATITPTTTSPTNGSSVAFSVHFSEAVQNFNAAADLVITEVGGVAHTGATITGGTQDYTVTVTGVTGSGTMTLAASASSDVRDLASNALTSSVTSSAVTIDHTAPTAATITPTTTSPTNASSIVYSVHFSEAVQNFNAAADLVVTETGGVAHTGATLTGGTQDYTVTVTGVTGSGTMTLAVSTGSDVRDLASNALASSVTSSAVTIDHTAPTAATITPTTTSPTNASSIVFSVHFSEAVQNFNAAADLVITETGGVAHTGASFAGGTQDYTVTVTGVTGSGTMTVAVSTSSDVRDLASNALTSSVTSSAVTIDHTAPTAATITPTTTSPTNGSSVVFSVHFSEAVQNFNAAADLVITKTGGVANTGASFAGGTQDFTVTVTGVTGSGTMTLAVSTSSDVRDLSANALASSVTSSAVTIDHTAPTAATIAPTTTSPTSASSVVFSVHFSEAVQNFNAAADLVVTETGGVAHTGASITGGTQDYTVTVTGVTGSGTMTLAVSTSSDVRDLASNALASSVTSSAVTIDHTAPAAATITPTTTSPTSASSVVFSVHFSEAMQNFNAAADLVVTETGGVAHTGASITGGTQDYTVTVTGVTGSGTMTLAASTGSDVQDLAANPLASSVTSSAVTVDHTAPAASTVTPTTTSPTNAGTIAFSVHFSESVQYFNGASDLVIAETGGVAHTGSSITGGPQDYTVNVSGVTGSGTMTLAVSTSSDVRDLASNLLASSVTSSAVAIDHTAPTATTIVPATSSPTNASSVLFSVHFSESIQYFNNASDLVVNETGGVAHTGASVTGSAQDYTVTVSGVTGNGTMTLAVNAGSDVRDLAMNALASSVTSSAVTLDHTAPTATTVTPTTSSPSNGSSVAFSVHFSEGVQNFNAAADLVITETGVVTHTGASITGGTQDYTVTVSGVSGTGTMTLAVSTGADIRDFAANPLSSSVTSAAVQIDQTAPAAAGITPTTTSPTNGSSVAFSVHFSEDVQNFNAAADLVLSETGGVAHTGATITGGPQDYSVTATGVTGTGTMSLAVSTLSDVRDMATNALVSSVTSSSVTVDHTGPSATSITPTTPSPTGGSTVSFSVQFDEAVSAFNDAADLVITETGTVAHTGATVSGGPQDYTVTATGVTGTGTMTLAVNTASDIRDLATNALASSVTSSSVTVDHTGPSATSITPTTASPTNGSTAAFSVHFSESVQNFNDAADLVITETGGVAHTGASVTGGPQDYAVSVTGITGTGTLSLAVSTSSDVNNLLAIALVSSAVSSELVIDHTPPEAATIAPNATGPTNAASILYSVHFDDGMQNFNDAADLVITETGGVAHTGASITGGPQDYSVSVTGVTGNGTMTLAANTASDIRDLAGNALNASVVSAAVTIDHAAPSAATITPVTSSPTNASAVRFSVHFSEAVQNIESIADLVITEAGVAHTGASVSGGPQDYTVDVSGVTGNGTIALAISTGSDVRDLAGNALAASVTSAAITADHTAPVGLTLSPGTSGPTNASVITFAAHFSESVQHFDNATDLLFSETGNVTHTGAAITGGPQDYTVSVTGVAGTGTMMLAISTGSDVSDLASNALVSAAASTAVTIDHTAPHAVSITPSTTGPVNSDLVGFTVHFSESVQNFNNAADLVFTESSVAHTGLTISGGPQDYSVSVTGITGTGTMALRVKTASDIDDLAGNGLASSVTSTAVTFDHTPPSVSTITPANPGPTNASTIVFSLHCSEAVQNLNNESDLVVAQTGSVSHTGATVSGGPQDYSVAITGVTGTGSMTLAVKTDSDVRDLATNLLSSSVTSSAVLVDHTAPAAASIVAAASSPTNANAVVFAVHFSESVQNFNTAADLVVSETGGVAHTGATFTGAAQDYSVTITGVTGSGSLALAVNTASDVRDAALNPLASSVTSAALLIDHSAPSADAIAITSPNPTNGNSVTFSVHFSEDVQGFDADADLNIVQTGNVTRGAASVTGGPQDYAVVVSAVAGDGTMTLAVNTASDVRDPAANPLLSSVSSAELLLDHIAPTLTVDRLSTNDTRPPLSGTVDDPDASITVSVNAQTVPALNEGDGRWTVANDVLAAIPEGVYDVQAQATDAAGNTGADVATVDLTVDTTPPVIHLIGAAELSTEAKQAYADPGATATDNLDPAVAVTATGLVNTDLIGTYALTFNAQDAAGNDAIPVERTVHVVDTTPPAITLLGDDPVTVQLGQAYSDAGASAYDGYDGDISAQIVVTGLPLDTSVAGEFTIRYNVADSSGNTAGEQTRTVVVTGGFHSADTDQSGAIELSELLRVIQFFNMSAYHCQPGTEDGYDPGTGDQSCAPHDSDYLPLDWNVTLSELLRAVQIFSFQNYYACPDGGTEDGYCLGLQP